MAIAGLAVGATQGYIYVRSEYPHAIVTLNEAIARATAAGWLGRNVAGSGKAFALQVRVGAGSYVCGEETAMLESIEGRRGIVRAKPPLPAIEGLFGKPTVINNVITLATVPIIMARGAAFYQGYGMGRSRGTLPFQLAGNIARGGLVEKAFGLSLRELVEDFGGGTATGDPSRPFRWAVRWAAMWRPVTGMIRWTMKPMQPRAMWWAMAGWSCMTTAPTWHSWHLMPWSSVPSNPAANARPAA